MGGVEYEHHHREGQGRHVMNEVTFEAQIAPIAGAVKVAGKDGSWRVTFEAGGESLAAMFALAAMIDAEGQAVRVTVEAIDAPRYGGRE